MKNLWPSVTCLRSVGPVVSVAAAVCVCLACEERVSSLGPGITHDATYLVRIGGAGEDVANAIQAAPDGGHFVVGWTDSYGSGAGDVYVIKLDPSGRTSWEKTYGNSGFGVGEAATVTSDGGLVIVGWIRPADRQDTDILLLRLDSRGNMLWERTFGGANRELGLAVTTADNGGFILAGLANSTRGSNSDVLVIKVDVDGNLLWQKNYGGEANDGASSITEIPNIGYVVAGFSESFGSGTSDAYLVAIDYAGDLIWQQTTGWIGRCEARSVTVTSDDGLVICGVREVGKIGVLETFLEKFDLNGNQEWQSSLGGDGFLYGESILSISDGSLIVVGYTNVQTNGIWDAFILKTDKSGNQLWQYKYGGANADLGFAVSTALNGGFAIAGWTKSFGAQLHDILIVRTDSLGQIADSTVN